MKKNFNTTSYIQSKQAVMNAANNTETEFSDAKIFMQTQQYRTFIQHFDDK